LEFSVIYTEFFQIRKSNGISNENHLNLQKGLSSTAKEQSVRIFKI